MPSNLLITGASGYIASHLLNSLDLSNYDDILLIDRTLKVQRFNKEIQAKIKDKSIKIKELDLSASYELDWEQYSTVIHCAYLNNNEAELKFLSKIAKTSYLVYLSTAAVYGENTGEALDIDSACNPVNRYGLNKLRLEDFIKEAFDNYAILRISNPYGKEYAVRGFYQIAKIRLDENQYLTINADKENQVIRDFIHIDELIEKIKIILAKQVNGVFNLSTGEGQSLEEFLKSVIKNFNLSLLHYQGLNPNEIKNSVLKPSEL